MKKERLPCLLRLLLLNAAVLVLVSGCATQPMKSFNQDYGQNYPSSPKYAVENVNDHEFKIVLHQGSPLSGPARVIYMKQAASAVAETEAKQRGWQKWDLNYLQERDQGWMHILIAVVTRKNPVELTTPASSGGSP
ncbi:MAG TPA: hypothetical protein VFY06_06975 [Verrucomicrobiae bacterium]|nr:hypothetical protein [Verrucomicrobiae bacterium]